MNIHEYQAKAVLREFGVAVPRGLPAFSVEEAVKAADDLDAPVLVVKAQIHAGGRGKAGGVKVVKSKEEVRSEAGRLLGAVLVTHQTGPHGKEVRRLYIEEGSAIEQEIYLSALDQQSADAMSRLAGLMNDAGTSADAHKKAEEIRAKLEPEYYDSAVQFYAFSRNADGSLDRTATIYPAVAWWTGRLTLPRADPMLSRWASPEFSADWGTRDISERTPFYDPVSYHQGSIWPLFTGWVSLAEYRAGRTLAGYAHLMQNASLTWAQDLGSVTELLSGDLYQPLGRSSSHQIWSSAMVVTPALRGLFGLDWDALHHTLRLAPNLPSGWDSAQLHNVPLANSRIDLQFTRQKDRLLVRAKSAKPEAFCLVAQTAPRDQPCREPAAAVHELVLQLPAVEIGIPCELPLPGARTAQLKVVGEQRTASRYEVVFEAPGGAEYDLPVRINQPNMQSKGAELAGSKVRIRFPAGEGYQQATVIFSW